MPLPAPRLRQAGAFLSILLMNEGAGPLMEPEGAFPGMLGLVNKSIAATLAEDNRVLLKDLFLKLFRVGGFDLIHHPLQLMVDVLLSFQDDPVKVGEDPDLSHIRQAPRRENLSTSEARAFFHGLPSD